MSNLTEEKLRKDARTYADRVVKAKKALLKVPKSLSNVGVVPIDSVATCNEFHMSSEGFRQFAELLDISVNVEPWVGNAQCKSNYNEVYFVYDGIKFFSLETVKEGD